MPHTYQWNHTPPCPHVVSPSLHRLPAVHKQCYICILCVHSTRCLAKSPQVASCTQTVLYTMCTYYKQCYTHVYVLQTWFTTMCTYYKHGLLLCVRITNMVYYYLYVLQTWFTTMCTYYKHGLLLCVRITYMVPKCWNNCADCVRP